MRIFLLVRSLDRGGAERQLVAVANGLAARGHDVAVAVFYSGGSLERDLEGVEIIRLEKRGRWDVIPFCYRLVRAVRTFRPEAIYSFLGTSNLLAGTLRPFWPGTRVVWSVRSSDMDYSYYDKVAAFSSWLEMKCSRFADRIVANSAVGLKHAVSRGMSGENAIVIHNGIDTDRFVPDKAAGETLRRDWNVPENDIVIGLVARIDPMKDHETFLRAAKVVADTDPDIRFVCIGGGESGYVRRMKGLAEDLGLGGSLTWSGELEYMEAAYSALDICCLSSMTEGFPNVVGEAMSCAIPCVVTDVGDAAKIVGDAGLVVPRQDYAALAEALVRMVAEVRAGTWPNPRQRVLDMFSLDRMTAETEKALRA